MNNAIFEYVTAHHNCWGGTDTYSGGLRFVTGFTGSGDTATSVGRQTNSEIRYCTAHTNGVGSTAERGHGIWMDTSGLNCRTHHNTSYNNRKFGVHVEWCTDLDLTPLHQRADHNVCYGNEVGIALTRKSIGVTIDFNTCYGNGQNYLVQGEGTGNTIGMVDNVVENNVGFGS